MKYFYNFDEFDEIIENDINTFINVIRTDKILKKYIKTFGIVGPCSRGEGFYFNDDIKSDIDFYVVTHYINPFHERYLNEKFKSIFDPILDSSILVASPTIYKKPDLMFFEFTNSGKTLYGSKLNAISLDLISKFECFRNIIYRGCFFLSLFKEDLTLKQKNKDLFLYYYSKVIFSIGEVFLLLNKTYVASNFGRNELIGETKYVSEEFIKEHHKMHNFRYFGDVPDDFNFEKYSLQAFKYIADCYDVLFGNLISYDKFKHVRAKGVTFYSNRFFFFIKTFKVSLSEPFIDLNLMFYDLVKNKNYSKFNDILLYWKNAGWFYFKK